MSQLQDKIAEYLSTRSKTLYVGCREDENREWVHFLRDKTLPEYDGNKAVPTTGGIIAEGPSETEMDALKFRIMAHDVLKIINQETAP